MGSIPDNLLNEICILKYDEEYLLGKISKIFSDKFAISLLSLEKKVELKLKSHVEIRVESLDERIYFYVALVDSQHIFNSHHYVLFKPVSEINSTNKRVYPRLKVKSYFPNLYVQFTNFPQVKDNKENGEVIDISEGGIQLKTNNFHNIGELIGLKLSNPFLAYSEVIICRVLQTTKEKNYYLLSLQFLNLSPHNQEEIKSFIEKTKSEIIDMAKN